MANVTEQSNWELGIYQIETSDAVIGGVGGIANRQALQLANRTLWLKNQVAGLGTGKQDADSTLAALANLTTSANQMIYATGADQFALTPLTAFIRTLLDDADAATARTTIGAAPLVSPALTGTPTAPTAPIGSNTTQIATMAAVQAEFGARKFVSQNFSLSSQSVVSVSHPLGVVPSDIVLFAKFKTATSMFAVGDVICLGSGWFDDDASGNNYGFSLVASASSIKLIVGSSGIIVHNGGGSASATALQTTCDFFFVATIY